jgi:trimethylamine--corrinoid protein Co-methyltransferase
MPLCGVASNYYKPLSQGDIQAISGASIRILEEAGYMIEHEGALKMLEEVGCIIDYEKKIAKIPENVLMDYVKMAPARIRLCGRSKKRDVIIEPNRVHFDGGGGSIKIYDIETGERRDSTLKDLAMMAKITDALENVHLMDTPCMPNDIAMGNLDLNRIFATTNNTDKHLMVGMYDDPDKIIKMGHIIAGGEENFRKRPFFSMIVCTISPLKFEPTYVDKVIKYVKAGVPVYLDTCPTAGLNAPMTLAGLVAQANAESLFNVFFPQVIKQGAPAFYTVVPNVADMRTSRFSFGAVENGMMNAALAQMAAYYNLPLYSTAGLTEAKTSDFQAGVEKTMQVMLGAMAGGQLIHDTNGMLDSSLTYSADQLVLDNEVNGMVLRVLRGIEVNEKTIAEEVIKAVGPGGEFITQRHTCEHARTELYYPELAVRESYGEWFDGGQKGMKERAHDKVLDIVKNHVAPRLDDDIVRELKKEFPEIQVEECMV